MKTISKIALGVALMMPFGAFAAVSGNAVTSKGYVDSGLSQKANRADGGVGEIAVITTGGDYEGTGVAISDLATTASLAGYATDTELADGLATKQGTLTAGDNITIVGNIISAVATDLSDYETAATAAGKYAVKGTETVAANAATAAGNAATAAAAAQSDVDAVETTIGTYGDIVTHDAAEFATAAAIADMETKTNAAATYELKGTAYTKAEADAAFMDSTETASAISSAITNKMDKVTCAADQMLLAGSDGTYGCVNVENGTYSEL